MEEDPQSKAKNPNSKKPRKLEHNRFPIVAIGASAGGLNSIERFFKNIPVKTGMAYVVVTHLDPDHISIMSDLISKYTPMPVYLITEGVVVKPNVIYVIPPRSNVVIKEGRLHLVAQEKPHYSNLPINQFFRSLALENKKAAAGIIFSGAGGDGTLGIRDIKLNGGLTLVQDPTTAKFTGMPTSAINSNSIDYILTPEQMPEQLHKWLNEKDMNEIRVSMEFAQIFSVIRSKTGYDFSSYKLTTIQRRIEKQMLIHNLTSLSDYVLLLKKDENAVEKLYKDFLIGVTRFFRDQEAFDVLKNTILPKILDTKPSDYTIRVWVPGCSTGEEVYSIAIVIAEYMQENNCYFNLQIFGTDIDRESLVKARSGIYSANIEQDISPERIKKFFTKDKNTYKIKKEIRSTVMFGEQNLIKDPPFTRVDIISCRNLMIYLNVKLQKKIILMFHYSLCSPGALFLGSSESIGSHNDLFDPYDKKNKLFAKKNSLTARRQLMSLPETLQEDPLTVNLIKERFLPKHNCEIDQAIKKLLLDQYIWPCIVVNSKGDILYLFGKVNKYIKATSCQDNLNINDIIRNDLKTLIKNLLASAISKKIEVNYNDISIKNPGKRRNVSINLRIIPITNIKILEETFIILFDENITAEEKALPIKSVKSSYSANKLERELIYTKENLQATIEELESSNEELQSLNEELQSTNEEMETSKEEMHSLNEELVITNTELQSRIDQLATIHDDMTNLFNSTDIATFFLDNKLCIKRFTPKAQEFIHLIPTDIGRPINHFTTTLIYDKLMEDAQEVLRTLNQKIIEIKDRSQRWFVVRILPYRTITNMIDGVVITLTDITDHKLVEVKMNKLNSSVNAALTLSKHILDTVMMPLLVLTTTDFKITSANRSFYKTFRLLPEDVIGQVIYNIKGWDIPELHKILEKDYPTDTLFEGFELETQLLDTDNLKLTLNIRKIVSPEENKNVLLVAIGAR